MLSWFLLIRGVPHLTSTQEGQVQQENWQISCRGWGRGFRDLGPGRDRATWRAWGLNIGLDIVLQLQNFQHVVFTSLRRARTPWISASRRVRVSIHQTLMTTLLMMTLMMMKSVRPMWNKPTVPSRSLFVYTHYVCMCIYIHACMLYKQALDTWGDSQLLE